MLINLAQAIGRLVLNGKELSRLAGYTSRVDELITTLDKLNKEQRNEIPSKLQLGTYRYEDNVIRFQRVPIVTPNGDVLLKVRNRYWKRL
jgi:ATP-binding cassette subfamily D (ALD) protein 3